MDRMIEYFSIYFINNVVAIVIFYYYVPLLQKLYFTMVQCKTKIVRYIHFVKFPIYSIKNLFMLFLYCLLRVNDVHVIGEVTVILLQRLRNS